MDAVGEFEQGTSCITRNGRIKGDNQLDIISIEVILEAVITNNVPDGTSVIGEQYRANDRSLGDTIRQMNFIRIASLHKDLTTAIFKVGPISAVDS